MFFVELIPRKRKEKRRMKAKKEREINNSSPSIFFSFPPQTTPPLPLILAFLFNIHLASLSLPTRKKGRRRRGMLGAFSFSRVCAKLPILRLIVPKIVLPNRVYERRIKRVAPGTSVCRTKKTPRAKIIAPGQVPNRQSPSSSSYFGSKVSRTFSLKMFDLDFLSSSFFRRENTCSSGKENWQKQTELEWGQK